MPGSCFSRRNFVKAAGALAGGSLLTQSFGCKGPATSAPKEAALPAGAADYTLNIAVKPVELGPNRPSKRCLDIRLAGFLFFEEALQVETANGRGGGIETLTHFNFLSHLLSQVGRNVESLRLAVDEYGNLELGMKVLAVGATAVGPTTRAFAFDK